MLQDIPRSMTEIVSMPRYTHNCRQKRYGETCGVTCAIGYFSDSFGTQFRCNGTFSGNLEKSGERFFEIVWNVWMPQVFSFSSSFLSGTLPSCQPNPCTDVPVLGNLFKGNCEGLSTGESCELSCNAPCPIWRLHTFLCTFDKPFALNQNPHTDHTPAQHLMVLCFFYSVTAGSDINEGFGV